MARHTTAASVAERPWRHRVLWLMSPLQDNRAEGADVLDVPIITDRRTISDRNASG
jgi:hypothetical protein